MPNTKLILDDTVKTLIAQLNVRFYAAEINTIAHYKHSLLAAAFNNVGKSFAMGLLNECAVVINNAMHAGEALPSAAPHHKQQKQREANLPSPSHYSDGTQSVSRRHSETAHSDGTQCMLPALDLSRAREPTGHL